MDSFVQYFESIPSSHRSMILFGGLTFFMLLETGLPFFRFKYKRWKHFLLNLFFTFTTILVNFFLAVLLIKSSQWVTMNEFGLINLFSIPFILQLIIGLMLMDLISAWFAHWSVHQTKWLWQFHIIHHSDQQVDATTANRHHPGESMIRFAFTLLAVFVIGAPIWLVMVYQASSAFLSQFNHSNIKLPLWLDNALMLIICSPNMHRVHHHFRQPYSDKNFGNIFSIWDRLFGTFVKVDNNKLIYGLDTHMEAAEAESVVNLLKIPFQRYRPEIEYKEKEVL